MKVDIKKKFSVELGFTIWKRWLITNEVYYVKIHRVRPFNTIHMVTYIVQLQHIKCMQLAIDRADQLALTTPCLVTILGLLKVQVQ